MRKSIDGLCAIVQDQLHMERRRSACIFSVENVVTGLKALLWNPTDLCCCINGMEFHDRFRWPRNQLEAKGNPPKRISTGSCPVLKSNNQKHSNLRNDRVKPLCQPTKMEKSFRHPVSYLQSLVNTGFSASCILRLTNRVLLELSVNGIETDERYS